MRPHEPGRRTSTALRPPQCLSILDAGPAWPGRAFVGSDPVEHRQVEWGEPLEARRRLLGLIAFLEEALRRGRGVGVLALAYEAGWLLAGRTPSRPPARGRIVADLALYAPADAAPSVLAADAPFALSDAAPALDFACYGRAVERTRGYIGAGDVYQLNLVNATRGRAEGDPLRLYRAARDGGGSPYLAFIERPGLSLVSLSPERFLKREGAWLGAAPIKGTARRAADPAEDARIAAALAADPKNRAENVMIADLFRSDLGRVAQTGSVRVTRLAAVSSFPTVHHLVSEVEARVRPGTSLAEILAATFPSGSITGAPKLRAMELISELEPCDRGFAMGALGVFRSPESWEMSVLIRTLEVCGTSASFPVGGAITWDSTPEGEWEECRTKRLAFEAALASQAADWAPR